MQELLLVLNRRFFEREGSPIFEAANIKTILQWAKDEPDRDGGILLKKWKPIVRIFHTSLSRSPLQDITQEERSADCYDLAQASAYLEWFYRELTGKEDPDGAFYRMVIQRLLDIIPQGHIDTKLDSTTSDQVSLKSSSSESGSKSPSPEPPHSEESSNPIKENEFVQNYWLRVFKKYFLKKMRP